MPIPGKEGQEEALEEEEASLAGLETRVPSHNSARGSC